VIYHLLHFTYFFNSTLK